MTDQKAWWAPYPSPVRYWVMQLVRERPDLTQEEIGERLGISHQRVSQHIILEARRQHRLKQGTAKEGSHA